MVSRTDRGAHGAAGDAGTYGRFPVRVALGELGADIKANGLGVPIEFWQDGKDRFLIDGRNRLEAMERVGIEDYPATETCFRHGWRNSRRHAEDRAAFRPARLFRRSSSKGS